MELQVESISEIDQVKELIRVGRQRKAQESLEGLNAIFSERTESLKKEGAKLHTIQVVIDQADKKKTEANKHVGELQQVKDQLSMEEYRKAMDVLTRASNKADKDKAEALEQYGLLWDSVNGLTAELAKLDDKKRALTDPSYAPRFQENRGMEPFLEECRESIRKFYEECSLLRNVLADHDPDITAIHLTLCVAAGNLRRLWEDLQTPSHEKPINAAEERILWRSRGTLVGLCQDFQANRPAPLCMSYKSSWPEFIQRHKKLLNDHLADKKRNASSGPRHKPRTKEPQEPKEDKALMEMIIGSGLLDKTRDLRLAIYGGKKRLEIMDWLQDAMSLKKATWYEYESDREVNSLEASLRNKGVDVLLILTNWVSGSNYNKLHKLAKDQGIATALCGSSSKKEACGQIAFALGLRLQAVPA